MQFQEGDTVFVARGGKIVQGLVSAKKDPFWRDFVPVVLEKENKVEHYKPEALKATREEAAQLHAEYLVGRVAAVRKTLGSNEAKLERLKKYLAKEGINLEV